MNNNVKNKRTVQSKLKTTIVFLFNVLLFIHLDCFAVSCRVLEISSLEYSGT